MPKSQKTYFFVISLYRVLCGLISLWINFIECIIFKLYFKSFYIWEPYSILFISKHFSKKNSAHIEVKIKSNPKGVITLGPISKTEAILAIAYYLKIKISIFFFRNFYNFFQLI